VSASRANPLGWIALVLVVVVAAPFVWRLAVAPAATKDAAKPAPPAEVPQIANEAEFNTIRLTEKAQQRLGIQTKPVERRKLRRTRVLGGEATVPVGRTSIVSAPLGGVLSAPEGGIPLPGKTVEKGKALFLLAPLVSPEARATLAASHVDTEGQLKSARTQLEAADIALHRAKNLLAQEAGSKRQVDEAQAVHDLAAKNVEAAQARSDLLARLLGDIEKGTVSAVAIESPQTGVVRNVSALAGQAVPSGAALAEIVDVGTMWVRVPVYVGDASHFDAEATAQIGPLAARPGEKTRPGRRVAAPPSANPLSATVDWYYEVDSKDGLLAPGEKVSVAMPLVSEAESLIVPWSAVIHDINGGTWVYENTAERTYVRRRAQVRSVADGVAELASGPAPGAKVVTTGAAELFGTEVGFAK
jgi:RND family efflux transporter MFP subunit